MISVFDLGLNYLVTKVSSEVQKALSTMVCGLTPRIYANDVALFLMACAFGNLPGQAFSIVMHNLNEIEALDNGFPDTYAKTLAGSFSVFEGSVGAHRV